MVGYERAARPGETCTVGPSAVSGERCGEPGVVAFVSDGETFVECARHAAPGMGVGGGGIAVGDKVPVERMHGVYQGTVVEVGARGAVYAEFTYNNGRTVRTRV